MNRPTRATLALVLLTALPAGSGCAPMGSTTPSGVLERVADGDYDVGIRYPSKRTRYVMIVDSDDETLALTNRPAFDGREAPTPLAAPLAAPEPAAEGAAAPGGGGRVLAPCGDGAGNWYRHTPAGYVCAGGVPATGAGG